MFGRKLHQSQQIPGPRLPVLGQPKPPPTIPFNDRANESTRTVKPKPRPSPVVLVVPPEFPANMPGPDIHPRSEIKDEEKEESVFDDNDKEQLRQLFRENPELLKSFYNLKDLLPPKREK